MKKYILILMLLFSLFSGFGKEASWNWSRENDRLILTFRAPKGTVLYKNSTSVRTGLKLLEAPVPVMKDGEEVYPADTSRWVFDLTGAEEPFQLELHWQACLNVICFPPRTHTMKIGGKTASAAEEKTVSASDEWTVVRRTEGYRNVKEFSAFLDGAASPEKNLWEGKGIWLMFLLAFAGGILLNLTPCVLPMIPVNLAIITAGSGTRKERILPAAVYGAGMVLAYGIAGVLILFGVEALQFSLPASRWYFNAGAGVLFLLLGAGMLGAFNLDFTRFRTHRAGANARLTGIFLLGVTAALLSGACVAPVVLAVMVESARLCSEGTKAGALLPLTLGLGMALPWPLLASGLTLFPKPGAWMVKVKWVLGTAVILMGIFYLTTGIRTVLLSRDPSVKGTTALLEKAKVESLRSGKPVLLDFTAPWCKNCLLMEKQVFPDPAIRKRLGNYISVQMNIPDPEEPEAAMLLKKYNIAGFPSFLILKRSTKE